MAHSLRWLLSFVTMQNVLKKFGCKLRFRKMVLRSREKNFLWKIIWREYLKHRTLTKLIRVHLFWICGLCAFREQRKRRRNNCIYIVCYLVDFISIHRFALFGTKETLFGLDEKNTEYKIIIKKVFENWPASKLGTKKLNMLDHISDKIRAGRGVQFLHSGIFKS